MHLREEFVFTIVMERSLNSIPASIHQYFLSSVLFIYNLGYRDQEQRQGSIQYWLVQSTSYWFMFQKQPVRLRNLFIKWLGSSPLNSDAQSFLKKIAVTLRTEDLNCFDLFLSNQQQGTVAKYIDYSLLIVWNSMSSIPRLLKCGTQMYTRKQQLYHTTS